MKRAPAFAIARRSRPIDVLSPSEVRALLEACPRHTTTGRRNRALIALLYGAALRCAEALALELEDFNLDKCTLRVRKGKGGTPRDAAVADEDPAMQNAIHEWIQRRRKRRLESPTFLCTLRGGPVLASYVRGLMPRLAAAAGIRSRVSAHVLRHSRAVHMLREGATIVEVQAQLGHRDLRTTALYLQHVSLDELRAAANRSRLPSAAAARRELEGSRHSARSRPRGRRSSTP